MNASFVERFDLWNDAQHGAATGIDARIEAGEIETLRFVFADQHGVLRGKTLVAREACQALREGVNMTTTLLAKDTSHKTVFPVFSAGGGFDIPGMQGGADFILLPDPCTFRILPWATKSAWVLCDAWMNDGDPSPLGTRQILRRALRSLSAHDLTLIAGLEVEFHVFRLEDPRLTLHDSGQPGAPPSVSLLTHGYQYLTELRYDSTEALMELLRQNLQGLGLPLRSLEIEFGPSQFELTFGPTEGLLAADTMVFLRTAVKEMCRRSGYHATFMCRPRIPNVMSSGWHLHQSLRDYRTGRNAFIPDASGDPLSTVGMQYLAGLLAHARGSAALASPTVNGYRRYRPYSLAPDRATWGRDNRAAMLRVIGGPGQTSTRIENRIGEPTANPYLYLASQVYSGLDGLERELVPCSCADAPYESDATPLPRSLAEALRALREDDWLRESFGSAFVNYYAHIKQAEISRFELEVSEWEHREYFDLF